MRGNHDPRTQTTNDFTTRNGTMIQNGLIDNSKPELQLVAHLKRLITDPRCSDLCIATGYWDLPGTNLLYAELRDFIAHGGRLKILIGEEPTIYPYQCRPLPPGEVFPDFYIKQDFDKLTETYLPVGQFLVDGIASDPDPDKATIQIRVYGKSEKGEDQFLHAKCYIATGKTDKDFASAIMGSSNFTKMGLEGNAELDNIISANYPCVAAPPYPENPDAKSYLTWFNEKWENARNWSGHFITYISKSPIGGRIDIRKDKDPKSKESSSPLTPYELYIKLLQHRFADILDANVTQEIKAALPASYKSLDYQIDAVKQCCSIMRTHGGFMLGDVVGLGKTLIGALVIRRFLDHPDGRQQKVLVITPPAVKSAWIRTIEDFDKDKSDKIGPHIDFVTTGSVVNLGEWTGEDGDVDDDGDDGLLDDFTDGFKKDANYGLILIDESHRFRNSTTQMYQALDDLIARIGLSGNGYPYIGLLSATPQNNKPDDLKNQIYLFQRNHKCSTIESVENRDLEGFFAKSDKEYKTHLNELKDIVSHPENHKPEDREAVKKEIKDLSVSIRDMVLNAILVRRTRTDLERYYADDIKASGIVFPKIEGPHELKYEMDEQLATLFVDTMNLLMPSVDFSYTDPSSLCYWRYQAVRFLAKEEDQKKYEFRNLNVERFCRQLAKMTQMNLVKRLESSFNAFKSSLRNLRDNTDNMIRMWDANAIFICPQIDVNAELDRDKLVKKGIGPRLTDEQCFNDIRRKIEELTKSGRNEKGRNCEYKQTDFKDIDGKSYLEYLKRDSEFLKSLCDRWGAISYDPKGETFQACLQSELFDPTKNTSGKLVIFSEAIDTVDTICTTAERFGFKNRVLRVTAKNRKDAEQTIRENFDANYVGEKKNDYFILVTTEVLAEGVNLHRANVILNYDAPWNATRLMQRIGRVNRIGSTEKAVHVFNFLPSAQGDRLIRLLETAYTKLQMFHTLFGEDSKVFIAEEEVAHYELNKLANGEESPDEKYKQELKAYRAAHPDRYDEILARETDLAAAVSADGLRYFLVTSPTAGCLPVRVDPKSPDDAKVITYTDLLTACRPAPDAVAVSPLPADWKESEYAAVDACGQYCSTITRRIHSSPKIEEALNAITEIRTTFKPAEGTPFYDLLAKAFRLVQSGNLDLAKRVIKITTPLHAKESLLVKEEADEMEKNLIMEFDFVRKSVIKKAGNPTVYWGLAN